MIILMIQIDFIQFLTQDRNARQYEGGEYNEIYCNGDTKNDLLCLGVVGDLVQCVGVIGMREG